MKAKEFMANLNCSVEKKAKLQEIFVDNEPRGVRL